MIVGLTGKKQHGKDTVDSILVREHGFVRVPFADALKQSAAAIFDVPVETWDALKNDPNAIITFTGPGVSASGTVPYAQLTVREFLQRYGTEAHRDVFGGTFWTDVVRGRIEELTEAEHDVVVTDVRFPEEAALIKEHGGPVVCIYRPQVADAGDTHASEVLPEYDFILWNGGTMDELRNAVAFDILRRGLPDRRFGSTFTDERGKTWTN